ncbi:hypothetical protein [Jatrophihabitans sp.]|uniref:glycine-rich domain-containing protein n=1 Tax=Jatrophihabitans sp. TaxID=1932789 RepID=UPI0030C6B94A|nr:hypothetical protein [Jatrophihabitans sp.]
MPLPAPAGNLPPWCQAGPALDARPSADRTTVPVRRPVDVPLAVDEVRQRRVGRRALLTGGAAAFAALAGSTMLPGAASADGSSPAVLTYAPAPSGGDDTAALQAALPAQGVLYLQSGTYQLAGQLMVGSGQDLSGAGGGYGKSATVLQCTTPGAGVTISAGGGLTGNFRIDGNLIATQPLLRNGGIGNWVGRTFQAITVINSAQDGITCLGCQNDAWYNVVGIASARDSWVLDQGYGSALFSRCEFADAGRYNLRIDSQLTGGPFNTPSNHVFHQCLIEYTRSSSVSLVYLNSAVRIKFDHASFYASMATSGPLVQLTDQSIDIVFEDVLLQSTSASQGGVGVQVDSGSQLICTGFTTFQNLTSPIYLTSGKPIVDIKGVLQYNNCASRYAADPGMDPQTFIANSQSEVIASTRRTSNDLSYASLNPSAAGYLTFETAAGRKVWGSGTDYVGDVALSRRDVGALGVDRGQLLATGYGTTATRPTVTGSMAGAIRFNTDSKQLEVTDGGIWYAPAQRSKTFVSSSTFTVPGGVTALRVRAIGGGGGGGGAGNIGLLTLSGTCYGGAGGGSGMMIDIDLAVTPGDVLTIMIGAGGVGGQGGAANIGLTGNAGQAGTTGGTSGVITAAGRVAVTAVGGGGGAGSPGAGVVSAAPPAGAGAFGCNDFSWANSSPGCGSMSGYSAIPTFNGMSGGASGAGSSSNRGGGPGSAALGLGQRATAGANTNLTPDGSNGATAVLPGCGGNGGGAGGSGGIGGNGGAGAAGGVQIWWVS